MKSQPEIYGVDSTKQIVGYVGPTYCATASSVIQTPDRHQYLHLLVVFPKRPVDSDEPCLYVCSEWMDGSQQYVLGVFDDAGHRVLQNEKGDWRDFAAFMRRALELASEMLAANFVEHQHSKWTYKIVLSTSDEALNALIADGWNVACPSDKRDDKTWLLLRRARSVPMIAANV